jgi:hypothetical protein
MLKALLFQRIFFFLKGVNNEEYFARVENVSFATVKKPWFIFQHMLVSLNSITLF